MERPDIRRLKKLPVSGAFRHVRLLLIFAALSFQVQAELIARFHTTLGNVDVELQYQAAPQAVANFITLAQGSRPWVDSSNGKIRSEPFYDGTKIHRTINESSNKIAQGGSRKGDGSDGPGYTFKDEFSPVLTHVPYVLSMANAGLNSNGSQFFFSGNESHPAYDNSYTIFGIITDPASRSVVDGMITAGPNGTTINAVTFTRTDAAAVAFDEHAQNLPIVTCPRGSLTVTPDVSAVWNFSPAISTGEVFHAFRSTTMAPDSWVELDNAELHVGISAGPLLFPVATTAPLDDAAAPTAFYNLYVAKHPDSVAPSHLSNRTVTIQFSNGTRRYDFDSSGIAGTTTFTPLSGDPSTTPFSTFDMRPGHPSTLLSDAHFIQFIADRPAPAVRYQRIKVGCDSATSLLVTGRHFTENFDFFFGWLPFAAGPATITR